MQTLPKAVEVRRDGQTPKLRIVRLEPRIAPALAANHNETLVRDPANTEPTAAEVREEEPKPKPKLRIVKLEERIAPFGCCDDCGNDLL